MNTLSTINNPLGAPRGPGGVFLVIAGDARGIDFDFPPLSTEHLSK